MRENDEFDYLESVRDSLRMSEVAGLLPSDARMSEVALLASPSKKQSLPVASDLRASLVQSEAPMSSMVPMLTTESDEPMTLDQKMTALAPSGQQLYNAGNVFTYQKTLDG